MSMIVFEVFFHKNNLSRFPDLLFSVRHPFLTQINWEQKAHCPLSGPATGLHHAMHVCVLSQILTLSWKLFESNYVDISIQKSWNIKLLKHKTTVARLLVDITVLCCCWFLLLFLFLSVCLLGCLFVCCFANGTVAPGKACLLNQSLREETHLCPDWRLTQPKCSSKNDQSMLTK